MDVQPAPAQGQHPGYDVLPPNSQAFAVPFAGDDMPADPLHATTVSEPGPGPGPGKTVSDKPHPPGVLPQTLHKSATEKWLRAVGDFLGVAIGILFLAFGALVYSHDGDAYEAGSGSTADRLVQLSQYNPTIFPLVFAALVGGAMKNIATWKVQRRASVLFLEQLMGSQTIAGTVLTHIQLSAYNVLAVLLLVLWALSPLGSQASIRVITVRPAYTVTNTTITALPPFVNGGLLLDDGSSFGSEGSSYITTPFIACVSAARLLATQNQDLWNNLRLPLLERLTGDGDGDGDGDDDAVVVLSDATGLAYASLAGVPTTDLPTTGNTTFTLSGSYVRLDCPVLENVAASTNYSDTATNPPAGDGDCDWATLHVPDGFQIAIAQPCHAAQNLSAGGDRAAARQLVYEAAVSNEDASAGWVHLECTVATTYVDTAFACGRGGASTCQPTAVQRSADPPYSRNWTTLDAYNARVPAQNLLSILRAAFPEAGIESTVSGITTYLLDPANAIRDTYYYDTFINASVVAAVTRADYELRLAQLLNTVLRLASDPNAGGQGLLGGYSPVQSLAGDQNITATTTVGQPVIRCRRAWLGVLLAASVVMFLVGLAGALLRFATLVPDVLGSVALAMLPNQFGGLPVQSTTWSGREWASHLRGVQVRLGDVAPRAEVGLVGLAGPVDTADVGPVQKGRYYY
ncbi:hypothetical protein SPI_09278 [Niveomyces insectorum RCEF 264]|uniref:Uncharacterized protein n=1 Tax=Niveomyces insectorum RCEF 264 TaxID=1081102 RepID=A0A167M2L0_9HYPO|nr:hypothetical protein SPI_09278 [Niveomyces insectorum RCEF 264]